MASRRPSTASSRATRARRRLGRAGGDHELGHAAGQFGEGFQACLLVLVDHEVGAMRACVFAEAICACMWHSRATPPAPAVACATLAASPSCVAAALLTRRLPRRACRRAAPSGHRRGRRRSRRAGRARRAPPTASPTAVRCDGGEACRRRSAARRPDRRAQASRRPARGRCATLRAAPAAPAVGCSRRSSCATTSSTSCGRARRRPSSARSRHRCAALAVAECRRDGCARGAAVAVRRRHQAGGDVGEATAPEARIGVGAPRHIADMSAKPVGQNTGRPSRRTCQRQCGGAASGAGHG